MRGWEPLYPDPAGRTPGQSRGDMIQLCHCHGSSLRAILRRMATKRWRRTRSIGLPAAVAAAVFFGRVACRVEVAPEVRQKDVPDLKFADTNCDGIDGVVKQAVFVAPTGSDAAPGTRARPLRSLQAAVALAARKRQSVYAMVGRYDVGSGLTLADTSRSTAATTHGGSGRRHSAS